MDTTFVIDSSVCDDADNWNSVLNFVKMSVRFFDMSVPIEGIPSFEKNMADAKSAVNRKINIERKKKLIERKRKLICASTGCKQQILIRHHRKLFVD